MCIRATPEDLTNGFFVSTFVRKSNEISYKSTQSKDKRKIEDTQITISNKKQKLSKKLSKRKKQDTDELKDHPNIKEDDSDNNNSIDNELTEEKNYYQ